MRNKILLVVIVLLIPFIGIKKQEDKIKENKVLIKINLDSKIQEIDLEQYVLGVVAAEMPALFHIEALKAQSVAARTFAYSKYVNNNNYVFETNKNDQVYITKEQMKEKWGNKFSDYYNKINSVVKLTENEVIFYNNKPINSYYFSLSNGYTEDSVNVFKESSPYLNSVDSSWDKNNKNYEQSITISKQTFCEVLEISCEKININSINRNNTNHVETLIINEKEFTGIEIRKLLNLRSTDFIINLDNEIIITTYGYGHGVGMSQYGANYLANDNKKYKDILKYYYTGTEIKKINV